MIKFSLHRPLRSLTAQLMLFFVLTLCAFVLMLSLVFNAIMRRQTIENYSQTMQRDAYAISQNVAGMFGIKSFASIINEPQGAIMSVGVGEKRPVVRGDELAIATVMSVTLTCDHRVVDGAIGARFLAAFKGLIEDPMTMLV